VSGPVPAPASPVPALAWSLPPERLRVPVTVATATARAGVCPGCGGPVDPWLGPVPRVTPAGVQVFCSPACGLAARLAVPAEPAAPEAGPRTSARRWAWQAALLALGVLALAAGAFLGVGHLGQAVPAVEAPGLEAPVIQPPPVARDAAAPAPGRTGAGATAPGSPRPGLLELRRRSVALLETCLGRPGDRLQLTAAEVLAEQAHAAGLDGLRRALGLEPATVRQRAAEALARLGHAEGIRALEQDLNARRTPVVWAAAFALARLGRRSAVPTLKQVAWLAEHRLVVAEGLVHLGEEPGRRFLLERYRSSPAPDERRRAAVALAMTGDRTGLALLLAEAARGQASLDVALALQHLGHEAARPVLERALQSPALRVEAARALRRYGDVSPVESLAAELDAAGEEARLSGAAAILLLTGQARAEVR
jgi:HEAT repeat protein